MQAEQLGTGHAAAVGLDALDLACDRVLVLYGDTPLVDAGLLRALVEAHEDAGAAGTMVSAVVDDPAAYGRVLRGADGTVTGVVEARDAGPDALAVDEINVGVYAFEREPLARALDGLSRDNAQGEAYLPDVLPHLGGPVAALVAPDPGVAWGSTRASSWRRARPSCRSGCAASSCWPG